MADVQLNISDEGVAQNNPLTRKLNKLLEVRLDNDRETLEALKSLSEFFTENNIRTRRNLRGDLEKRSLAINEQFLQSFGDVKASLDALCTDMSAMSSACQGMMARLQATRSQTDTLMSRSAALRAQAQRLDERQKLAGAFLHAFQLTPDELQALRTGSPGDDRFFDALSRAGRIHADCKLLLRTSQAAAGLQLMEAMAAHRETAYERLYRWLQAQWRAPGADDAAPLARALASLRERPVLWGYALDELANARRACVVRRFIDALGPMEARSKDPLRYVADMLTWVHECAAGERQLLGQLLGDAAGDADALLGRVTQGLCGPLRLRVEQVAVGPAGPLMLHRLRELLRFYRDLSLGPLAACLADLATLADRMLANSLTCHCGQLLDKGELPPGDLGAPESLRRLLSLVREMLSCGDGRLAPLPQRQLDVPALLQQVLEPALEACQLSASRLSAADGATYLANCAQLAHSTLAPFECTEPWLERLEALAQHQLGLLSQEQQAALLSQLGLSTPVRLLGQGPLATLPGCDVLALRTAGSRLARLLEDGFPLPLGQLLASAGHRRMLRATTLAALCDVYAQLHAAVHDPANGYPDPSLLLPVPPEDIRAKLLPVQPSETLIKAVESP
ncbi:unnamed protein product [Ixodes pacificus]